MRDEGANNTLPKEELKDETKQPNAFKIDEDEPEPPVEKKSSPI